MTKDPIRAKWAKRLECAQQSYNRHDLAMRNCEVRIYKATFELLLIDSPLFGNVTYQKWAHKFFDKYMLSACMTAIQYASRPSLKVTIKHCRWSGDCDNKYHIFPSENSGFWLNSFSTKKQAIAFCKAMGWKV